MGSGSLQLALIPSEYISILPIFLDPRKKVVDLVKKSTRILSNMLPGFLAKLCNFAIPHYFLIYVIIFLSDDMLEALLILRPQLFLIRTLECKAIPLKSMVATPVR